MVDDTERYLRAAVAQGLIHPSQDERARAEMLASFSLGSQFLAQYLVAANTAQGRVVQLQRRFTVPALEVFTQGLYTSTELMDRYLEQSGRATSAPRSGHRDGSTAPNRTRRRVTPPARCATSRPPVATGRGTAVSSRSCPFVPGS